MGSYAKMYASADTVKPAIRLMQELSPLIALRGGKAPNGSRIMMHMPAGLLARGMRKVLTGKSVMSAIMERMESSEYVSPDMMAYFPRDVLNESHRMGVELPQLEALAPYFEKEKAQPNPA